METPNGATQRQALAERMSKLLGLPLTQIQLLIPLIPQDSLDHLAELGDADFLRESTKLINEAQMQQFQSLEGSSEVKPRGADKPAAAVASKPAESAPMGLRTLKPRGGEPRPQPSLPPDVEPEDKVAAPRVAAEEVEHDEEVYTPAKAVAPLGPAGGGSAAKAESAPKAEAKAGVTDDSATQELPGAAAAEGEAAAGAENKMPSAFKRADTQRSKAKQQTMVTMVITGVALAIFTISAAYFIYQVVSPAKKLPPKDTTVAAGTGKPVGKPARPSTAKPGPGGSKTPKSTEVVAVDPLPPTSGESPEVTPEQPTQPAEVVMPDLWAWKVNGEIQASMTDTPFSTADHPEFTVEVWLRAGQLAPSDQCTIAPLGKGDPFTLALVGTETGPHLRFAIPAVQAVTEVPLPALDTWTHVAGVYDPSTTKKLLLFVNGQLATQAELGSGKALAATGYQLTASVAAESTLLLDDLRISRSAMYNAAFEPERVMTRGPQTVALLRMERDLGDDTMGLADVVQEGKHQTIPGGSWIALKDLAAPTPVRTRNYGSGELPPEVLAELEKKFGAETATAFKKEFDQLSRDQKIEYLRQIGIRVK